jgi:hypothetical protein
MMDNTSSWYPFGSIRYFTPTGSPTFFEQAQEIRMLRGKLKTPQAFAPSVLSLRPGVKRLCF